jgi:hypothetical protein
MLTSDPDIQVAPPAAPRHPFRLAVQVVLVRLRFLLVFGVALAVVGYWGTLRNYWDKLTRPANDRDAAISADTEYWCPMCPGVLSDWPGKCPVCNMGLVRRKKGEAVPLPDGALPRMQFSPYRVQLAGIQTAAVEYRPLLREVAMAGFVEAPGARADRSRAWLTAEVFEKDLPFLAEGQAVEAASDLFPRRPPFAATVRELGPSIAPDTRALRVRVEIADPGRELRPGMLLTVTARAPAARQGWGERTFREGWEARTAVELAGHALGVPAGPAYTGGAASLLWSAAAYACLHRGMVPAVPESAVVDTGSMKVVYVESAPGMFDGVEVVVGPRCGDFYPVLGGLEAGQRVATAGAFLIDAQVRLSPGAAASYFGASRGASQTQGLQPLGLQPAADDQALAARQKTCPVTGEPLDLMGGPVRVEVNGRTVFVCCKGCEPALRKNPEKYLSRLPKQSGP